MREMSLIFSFGKFGGFYFRWGYMKRVCLGWFAITFCPFDIDDLFDKVVNQYDGTNH